MKLLGVNDLNTVLRVSYAFDAAERLWQVTDPRGIESRTIYDARGRVVKTVEAFVDGIVSLADDKTTEYVHDGSGNLTALKAWLSATVPEISEFVYGVRVHVDGSFV